MPVDARGEALRPAILGMDTRTGEQNSWLRERFGAEHLFARTGMPIHTINTLPKLLWLKQHEPELWTHAARFLLYEDFIIGKMTGQPANYLKTTAESGNPRVQPAAIRVPARTSADAGPFAVCRAGAEA